MRLSISRTPTRWRSISRLRKQTIWAKINRNYSFFIFHHSLFISNKNEVEIAFAFSAFFDFFCVFRFCLQSTPASQMTSSTHDFFANGKLWQTAIAVAIFCIFCPKKRHAVCVKRRKNEKMSKKLLFCYKCRK